MKHLFSWSVFEKLSEFPGEGDLHQRLADFGLDGLELFTLFEKTDPSYIVPEVVSVHLPYALDWHSSWEGRGYEGNGGDVRYFSFGRTREEMIETLRYGIDCAAPLHPAYGVLHAGNTDMRQVLLRKHESDDLAVLADFAEMVNSAVSAYPGGEPPFRLSFENLWWEGLKLRDPSEWRLLEDRLEFDNWGFTLDTGHLMNSCDDAFDEDSAIDAVMDIIDRYPSGMRERIGHMHLQLSTTAEYRRTFVPRVRGEDEKWDDFMKAAFERASGIDQHRPYSSRRVNEIVDAVSPDYVTHELMGYESKDKFRDLRKQRALMP